MLKFDWNMLWTLIDLLLFFVLMRIFLFKPIKKTIEKRKELIAKQFKDAEDAQLSAQEKLAEYEKKLTCVEDEKKQIIIEAKDSAKVEYGKIIDKAQADAQKLKDDARKQIEAESENAKRAAKEEIASIAMQAAEKVVGANVSAKTDSDIFDEFLNESSENND